MATNKPPELGQLTVKVISPVQGGIYSVSGAISLGGKITGLTPGQQINSMCYQLMDITDDLTGQPQSIPSWTPPEQGIVGYPQGNGVNLSPNLAANKTYSVTVIAVDSSVPPVPYESSAITFSTTP